ncbi:MAG: aspartate aminotransferase family protein [Saprospiraceae bacterium]|nr:aspartate aminotransferase family protein [Saprospiraceae bacterium]
MEYSNSTLWELDKAQYLQTFVRFPITMVKGEGSHVWDVEGKEYIDALAGIAVNVLGHNHPTLVGAIRKQAGKLLQISNFYLSVPQAMLSKKLIALSGLDRIFFTNSGAESVEGAMKIARKYAHSIGRGGEIISFDKSFHGRTLATIATGKIKIQKGFEPIPAGFKSVPFNDLDAVKRATSTETAAILIEPIQGEGGINVASASFLKDLRAFCTKENIVLIFDEIQCGIGRTGKMFAKDHFDVQPDIMALAKGLGGGVPVGAILSSEKVSSAMEYGDHGSTFGGNPLVCAASLAVLEVIEAENLLEGVVQKEKWFRNEIKNLKIPHLKEIRGKGLMLGIVFDFETKPLVAKMLEKGVLANATANNVLRLVPALNIPLTDLKKVVEAIQESYNEMTIND